MSKAPKRPDESTDARFLTLAQVAKELAMPLSTVHLHVTKGEIPGYRFKGRLRVERKDLERYIDHSRITPKKPRGRRLKDYSALYES